MESLIAMDEKDRKQTELIAKILQGKNLYKAYRRVVSNKGSSGVDGMQVEELQEYLSTHQSNLVREILSANAGAAVYSISYRILVFDYIGKSLPMQLQLILILLEFEFYLATSK